MLHDIRYCDRRLGFKSDVVGAIVQGRLILGNETTYEIFDEGLFVQVAGSLDGQTVADIQRQSQDPLGCLAALTILEDIGFISEVRSPATPDLSGPRANGALALDSSLTHVVIASGFEHYFDRRLTLFAEAACRMGRPWIPTCVAPNGRWIGPVVNPPATPCWSCVLGRLAGNLPVHAWLYHGSGDRHSSIRSLRSETQEDIGLDSTRRRELVTLCEQVGGLIRIKDGQADVHVLSRYEDCPTCGGTRSADRSRGPRNPHQTAPAFADAEGKRHGPHEVFQSLQHHISFLTGLVHSITPIDCDVPGCYVFEARHSLGYFPRPPFEQPKPFHFSYGRGATPSQARTGALCEALERISGVFRGTEARVRAARRELGARALSPVDWLHYSESQIAELERSHRRTIPGFDEAEELDWTPVTCLTTNSTRYAPTFLCYYNHPESAVARADSSGTAAGITMAEAVANAFLELVERDAVGIWWYRECLVPHVDLCAVNSPLADRLQQLAATLDATFRVFDVTHDLGVPVFVAAFGDSRQRVSFGFGAHFNADVALRRALTELVQGRSVSTARAPMISASPNQWNWLFAPRTCSKAAPAGWGDPSTNSGPLRTCVAICKQHHLGLHVLDQTREDVGLPTVRVIVTELQPAWRRLGPGRLYTVPSTIGWQSVPALETMCNPSDLYP